jgi:hypothetical protein
MPCNVPDLATQEYPNVHHDLPIVGGYAGGIHRYASESGWETCCRLGHTG